MKTITSFITGSLVVLFVMIFSLSGYSTKWVITVQDFQFTPSSLPNVNSGDTIHWQWVSGVHTTTSTTIPAGAWTWDAPIDAGNTSYEYLALIVGTYNYHCMHHPSLMMGSFVVSGFVPTLNVTPPNQNVTYISGSTDFNVTSNTDWTALSDSPWCVPTPSGTGNGTIVVNYQANPSINQRVAQITVTVNGLAPVGVNVTQAGEPLQLGVTPSNQDVGTQAGSTDFSVMSNTDWVAESNSPWCTVTPSGTGNGTLTAMYTDNPGSARVDTITITVNGLTPQKVTVSQDGTTGIVVNATGTLSFYPNPSNGKFTVIPGELAGKTGSLTIMDLAGNSIFSCSVSSGQEYSIDLSSYPGGYYFLKVSSDMSTITRKLILDK